MSREQPSGTHTVCTVTKDGVRRLPELSQRVNPGPYDLVTVMEVELTRRLWERDYRVWQN